MKESEGDRESLRDARQRARREAAERELQQAVEHSLGQVRGLDPNRHRLAVEVAEALARCGLWLGDSRRPGGGGAEVTIPGAEVTDEVYVGWSAPEAILGAPFELRAYQIMLQALAELLELMGFRVDRHGLPALGVQGLIVTRREEAER